MVKGSCKIELYPLSKWEYKFLIATVRKEANKRNINYRGKFTPNKKPDWVD